MSRADRFAELLAAHRGVPRKIAASYTRLPADRAELEQEILYQLWRAFPTYDATRPFSTWMYRVALNVALSSRRSARPVSLSLEDHHDAIPSGEDLEARHASLALVRRALQALGPLERALLLLHLEGCSHREAAEVLGTTEGNVATRLGRIRQRLRLLHPDETHEGPDGTP